MFSRVWKSKMSRSEQRRGLVFFLLYLLVLPYLNSLAQRILLPEAESLAAEATVAYYILLFVLSVLLFWSFLRRDFEDLMDWLPENLFGILAALVVGGVFYVITVLIPLPVTDPIPLQYAAEFSMAPVATVVLLVVLIPVVEEILFRGLVYGSLRQFSLPVAFVLTVILYSVACVWRYALDLRDLRYLLLTVRQLPLAAGYTWCYENGGSVWGCILLHGAANAVILALSVL